jgi:heme exporter protein A
MPSSPLLSCENISLTFNDRTIFSHCGFSLLPGSLLLLKGPNGSGKTSLIKALAGIYAPSNGHISTAAGTERHYIGHELGLKMALTVWDNLHFYAALHGTEALLAAAIYFWDLEAFVDIPCQNLSAGWKKRVALARLIACPVDLWFLDEADANLDIDAKKRLETLIRSRQEQGGVVVLSSHLELDLPDAAVMELPDFA